jgi:hypothetical protein
VSSTVVIPPTSGGGGGGGGRTALTYTITKEQLASQYSKELERGDKVQFEMENSQSGGNLNQIKVENHTLTVEYIGKNYTQLSIQSSPIKLNLAIGEEKKLNMGSKDYYDLYIKLVNITKSKADITMKAIYELMPGKQASEEIKTTAENKTAKLQETNETGSPQINENGTYRTAITIILIAIVVIFIVYFLIRHIISDIKRIDEIESMKRVKFKQRG